MNIRLLLGVSAILLGTGSDLYARTLVPSLLGPGLVNHGVGFVPLATTAPRAPADRVLTHPGGDATRGPVVGRWNRMKLAGSKPGGVGDGDYGE